MQVSAYELSKDLLNRRLIPPSPTTIAAADAYEGVNDVLTSAPWPQLNGVYYGLAYYACLTVRNDGCQSYVLWRKGSFPPLLVAYVLKSVFMLHNSYISYIHMYVCSKRHVMYGMHLSTNGNQTDKPSEPSGKIMKTHL